MVSITKLQYTILIIVEEINRICMKNNISFSMDGGTLLGAVRHKGFIPWDDDIDIGLKRGEYERLLQACKTDLDSKKFTLQTYEVRDYAFSFAKIHLNNTEIVEDFSKQANVHHGIFIDIFPYDNLPDRAFAQRIFLIKNHLLKNLIWVKCNYGTEKQRRKISYGCFKAISLLFSIEKLKEIREQHIVKYNIKKTKECFTSDYPMYHLENKWFDKLTIYKFENKSYPGFDDYDAYLSRIYGDYMELPSEEKRKVHTTQKIDFGSY